MRARNWKIEEMSKNWKHEERRKKTDSICYGSFTVTIAQSIWWTIKCCKTGWNIRNWITALNNVACNEVRRKKIPSCPLMQHACMYATGFKCNASNCASYYSVSQSFTQSWCYLQFLQLNWLAQSPFSHFLSLYTHFLYTHFAFDGLKKAANQFRSRE